MEIVARTAENLQSFLFGVANEVAQQTGVILREREFNGASLLQTVLFTFDRPEAVGVAELAQQAAVAGVHVSPQAAWKRLTDKLANFLKTMLERANEFLVDAQPRELELFLRFPGGIYVVDSTVINLPAEFAHLWPACGGSRGQSPAALKVQVRLELTRGTCEIQLEAGRQADSSSSIQDWEQPENSLRVTDLGYFALLKFQTLAQQEQRYFLSRLPVSAGVWINPGPDGEILVGKKLYRWLEKRFQKQGQGRCERSVRVGREFQLDCRLIAFRVPDHIFEHRLREVEKEARRRGRPVTTDQREAARWTIFITNLPATLANCEEIGVLYRVRWQIELLFKLWKDKKNFDLGRLRQRLSKPVHCLIAIYAKLLGVLVRHALLVMTCWHIPRVSFVRAGQLIRDHLQSVALQLHDRKALCATLTRLCEVFQRPPRLHKKRHNPNSHDLLENPALLGWGLS